MTRPLCVTWCYLVLPGCLGRVHLATDGVFLMTSPPRNCTIRVDNGNPIIGVQPDAGANGGGDDTWRYYAFDTRLRWEDNTAESPGEVANDPSFGARYGMGVYNDDGRVGKSSCTITVLVVMPRGCAWLPCFPLTWASTWALLQVLYVCLTCFASRAHQSMLMVR